MIKIDEDAVLAMAKKSTALYDAKAASPGADGSFNRAMAAIVLPLNMHIASEINRGTRKSDAMLGLGAALYKLGKFIK